MSIADEASLEGEAPAEPRLPADENPARQEPRPPKLVSRVLWICVEGVLIVLILGLIAATVLPAIVGRSSKADQLGQQRPPRARPPVHSR